MNEDAKDKKIYELALLVKSEDELPAVVAFVREHSGEILSEPRAKKLALAYPIKGNVEAVFASCTFRAAGEDAKNLEHDLVTNAQVIRSMVIIAPPPSVERQPYSPSFSSGPKRSYPSSAVRTPSATESRPAAPRPLSNEALEKKIEEILQ